MFCNRIYSVIFITVFLSACSTVHPHKESFYTPEEAAKENSKSIEGEKYLFLADNQLALLTTEPIVEQSAFAEKTVNTAHRRAALDAFSLDIVKYITQTNNGEYGLIIHGGDLLNNSCRLEFDEAASLLNKTGLPWFLAPGNHDGYYLGITSPRTISKGFGSFGNVVLDERGGWAQACVPVSQKRKIAKRKALLNQECDPKFGRGFFSGYECYQDYVMDKVAFIHAYLEAIGVKEAIRLNKANVLPVKPLTDPSYHGYNLHCVTFDNNSKTGYFQGYLSDICWTQHKKIGKDGRPPFNWFRKEWALKDNYENQWLEKKPWRNFLIQKLKLNVKNKTAEVIIVDTSSYSSGEAINDNTGWAIPKTNGAADRGHLSMPQQGIIDRWVSKDTKTILVGHHPLVDFDSISFKKIQNLFESSNSLVYISGDTHDGYDVLHKGNNGEFNIREVNLGSTIDAPLEYAVGGFTGDMFVLRRKSLTPTKKLGRSGSATSKYKSRKKPKSQKFYADFNNKLWDDICPSNFEKFRPDRRPEAPFGAANLSPLSKYSLKGMWPVFTPFNSLSAFKKNLYAYKVNRLIELVEVYRKLYMYSRSSPSQEILDKELQVEKAIIIAKDNYFSEFYSKSTRDGGAYYNAMLHISELVEMLNEAAPNGKLADEFKLCSALYEAEREYKSGILEKIKETF